MALFRKVIEWTDDTTDTLVSRVNINGRDINRKSRLVVRPSQTAIFVHKGKIADIFEEGTYSLNTEILPILTKLGAWQYGFKTPITVDIYFINTKQFTNIKWGTGNPIIMRDPEFGVIRVRGYGAFAFKVDDPSVFLTQLFGTNSSFKTDDIKDYLKTMTISGLTDALGESKISALDLAGNTLEFNEIVKNSIQTKFKAIGMMLTNLFIENMSVPSEVEKALDERSKYGIMSDKTDVMMKVSAAEAMRNAAKNEGMGGAFMGAGVGMGAGFGMGQIMKDAFSSNNNETEKKPEKKTEQKSVKCPNCGAEVLAGKKFCGECGHKMPKERFCPNCGAKVAPGKKFCGECGEKL